MTIPDWKEYFMSFARNAALRSSCLRANVGAVIIDGEKRIIATGYNGTPSKVTSCLEIGKCYRIENKIPSGTRYETCRSIHAEQNAIIQAGRLCKNSDIYIFGHNSVCILCKRFIINSRIKTIYLQPNAKEEIQIKYPNEFKKDLEILDSIPIN